MFEQALERRSATARTRAAPLTAAILLHGAVLATAALVALLSVGTVEIGPLRTFFVHPADLPGLEGGRPPRARAKPKPSVRSRPASFSEPVQPRIVPNAIPVLPAASALDAGLGEGDVEGAIGGTGGPGDGTGTGVGDGTGTGFDDLDAAVPLDADMVAPRLLRRVEPEYPAVARRAGIEGRVHLQIVVGTDGTIEDIALLASTNPLLDAAAIDAVKMWRYAPARLNERPVRVFIGVTVFFRLR